MKLIDLDKEDAGDWSAEVPVSLLSLLDREGPPLVICINSLSESRLFCLTLTLPPLLEDWLDEELNRLNCGLLLAFGLLGIL